VRKRPVRRRIRMNQSQGTNETIPWTTRQRSTVNSKLRGLRYCMRWTLFEFAVYSSHRRSRCLNVICPQRPCPPGHEPSKTLFEIHDQQLMSIYRGGGLFERTFGASRSDQGQPRSWFAKLDVQGRLRSVLIKSRLNQFSGVEYKKDGHLKTKNAVVLCG
jgi:hypothetical protein